MTTEIKAPTKAELAQKIYEEVNGVRADFMKRAMEELGMSKPGASTYHQNCKTKANGGKVKSYYKSKKAETAEAAPADNAEGQTQAAPQFMVPLLNGTTVFFMSQAAADEWCMQHEDQVQM